MQIAEFGDKELWLVRGPGWCLPIYCTPFTEDGASHTHWMVTPARQLLAAPFAELNTRFAAINLGKSRTNWIIHKDNLASMAEKAPGVTPDYYLKWPTDNDKAPEPEETAEVGDEEKDSGLKFLRFVCERSAFDMRLARYFWRAMKDGMLEWLINRQQPIDLELFKIHPIPYRVNWKDILLARHPQAAQVFMREPDKRTARLIRCGFMEDLGGADLLAMGPKPGVFNWTLELEPQKLWLEAQKKAELDRLSLKGPVNYAKYCESCIRKCMGSILGVFATWVRQADRPVGRLSESGRSRNPVLISALRRDRVAARLQRPDLVTYQPFNGTVSLNHGQMPPAVLEKKMAKMLKMPDFGQTEKDMRLSNSMSELEGPRGQQPGTGGVPMLPAGQDSVAPGGVLGDGEGAQS